MIRPLHIAKVALAGLALGACSSGNLASELAKRPTYEPEGQAKSAVAKSQARPLIVEWPSSDRAALEAETRHGIVAVRYDGSTMELLSDCHAKGGYAYTPTTPQSDLETVRDADELRAKLPLGAASLLGKLEKSGSLSVAMITVGRYKADRASVRAGDLSGPTCGRATHVILALTAGAFEFFAGAEASVGGGLSAPGAGASGKSSAQREVLNRGGDKAACARATADDKTPPFGCGALLRIEVAAVGSGSEPAGEGAAAKGDAGGAGKVVDPFAKAADSAAPAVEEPHTGTLSQDAIRGVLDKQRERLQACYINGLGVDPKLRGKVAVRFVIGADGAVTKAADQGSDLPDKDVIGCIVEVIKLARFQRPEGGSVAYVYPILFSP